MSPEEEEGRKSDLPPGLEELEEHGVPKGWSGYWHGERRDVSEDQLENLTMPGSMQPDRQTHERPGPPRLFTDVARRLGFDPPNERPYAPRPIPPEVDLPGDRPPDFWDPREAGGFDKANIRPGFPDPEELGIEPLPEEEGREEVPGRWLEPGPPHGYTPDAIAY